MLVSQEAVAMRMDAALGLIIRKDKGVVEGEDAGEVAQREDAEVVAQREGAEVAAQREDAEVVAQREVDVE